MGAADTLKLFLDIFLNSVYVLKTNFTFLDLFFFTYIRIFFFIKMLFLQERLESLKQSISFMSGLDLSTDPPGKSGEQRRSSLDQKSEGLIKLDTSSETPSTSRSFYLMTSFLTFMFECCLSPSSVFCVSS